MTKQFKHFTAAAVSMIAICVAVPALAQQAPKSATKSDDSTVIVVTANKRKEKLKDVPQSIAVVTADQVQALNLTQFDDVQKVVPGLDITRESGREFAVSMRGVFYDPNTAVSPTVDLYMNEVPVDASTVLGAIYDTGEFEVLRGPQGTLRSGTGPSGAILMSSKPASLTHADGYYSISAMDQDNENFQFGYGLPLLDGKLGIRVAGLYDHNNALDNHDIYFAGGERSQTTSGRISATYQPMDSLTLHVMYQGLNSRVDTCQAVYGSGVYGNFTTKSNLCLDKAPQEQLQNSQILTYDATWNFAGQSLNYVGGYQKNNSDTIRDADDLNSFGPGIEEYQGLYAPTDTWTNELRFERTGDHFWIYRFGAFYGREATNNYDLIDYTGANGKCLTSPGPLEAYGLPCIQLGSRNESKSWGYFTTQQFTFSPSDIAEIGLRSSRFENSTGVFNALTGSANYKHYFTKNTMVYVNYGTSYRPGLYNSGIAEVDYMLPAKYFTTTPETSKSLEVGLKTDLFDRRLSLSADGFYQKFNGYVYETSSGVYCTTMPNSANGPTSNTVYPTNDGNAYNGSNGCTGGPNDIVYIAGNANVISEGIELEALGRITDTWTLGVNGTFTDSHFDNALIYCNDFDGSGTPNDTGTAAVQKGQYISLCRSNGPMSILPKWTMTFTTNYSFPAFAGWQGFVRGVAKVKPTAKDPFSGQPQPAQQDIDAFLGLTDPKTNLEVSFFVKNLLNQVTVVTQPLQTTAAGSYGTYARVNGLQAGVQIRQSF